MSHRGLFADSFYVGGKCVGPDKPTFIIAEIGSNHNQDLSQAKRLIDIAASAGANTVRLQTLDYEKLFHVPTTDNQTSYLCEKIELPEEWYPMLTDYTADGKIGLLHNSVKHVEDEAVNKAVQRCSSEI